MKKRILVLLLSSICALCQAQADSSLLKYRYNQVLNYEAFDSVICKKYHADTIIKIARHYIGVPYLAQGKTETGFDCSGFMFFLHKPFCVYLPYNAFELSDVGKKIEVTEARKGDLILFKGHDMATEKTGHVGMVISSKGEPVRFIHASSSHGVREDKLKANTYFEPRFLGIRRVVE